MTRSAIRPERGQRAVRVAVAVTVVSAVLPAPGAIDPYALRFAALAVAACAWAWAAASGGLRRPERADAWLLGATALFAGVVAAATAIGYAPADMLTFGSGYFMGAASWLGMGAVFALCVLARPGAGLRDGLSDAMAPAAAVAVVACGQAVTGAKVTAGFDNSNHLVAGLLLLAPVALALAPGEPVTWRKRALVGAAVLMACALALSGSAAGALGAFVALAVVAVSAPALLGLRTDRARRLADRSLVAIGVAGLLLIVAYAGGLLPEGTRTAMDRSVFGYSLANRFEMWRAGVAAAMERPALGVGADGYEVAAQRLVRPVATEVVRLAGEDRSIAVDPHSSPVLVLASFGFGGLLAALAALAAWAVAVRRAGGGDLRTAFVAAAAGWAAASAFLPLSVLWAGVVPMMLGLAVARGGTPAAGRSRVALAGAASVPALVLLALGTSALVASWGLTAAGGAGSDRATAQRLLAQARAAAPTYAFARFADLDFRGRQLGASPAAVAAFRRAVDEAGPGVTGDARYITMLVRRALDQAYLSGRRDLAWEEAHLTRLSVEFPNMPEVSMELAHLAILQGRLDDARDHLLAVTPYAPNLRRSALYRYYYAVAAGRPDLAAQARAAIGEDPELLRLLGATPPDDAAAPLGGNGAATPASPSAVPTAIPAP